jgi:hypothetical protein
MHSTPHAPLPLNHFDRWSGGPLANAAGNGMSFYEQESSADVGKQYRLQYQQFFRTGRMSWFPNNVETN